MFWIFSFSVMSPFSSLILLIWVLSLCPLVSLAKSLSILSIFSKHPLLVLLTLHRVFFLSRLIWAFSLIISCSIVFLCVFVPFCSRAFKYAVKLIVYELSYLFMKTLNAMGFPLSNALIVCCAFIFVKF